MFNNMACFVYINVLYYKYMEKVQNKWFKLLKRKRELEEEMGGIFAKDKELKNLWRDYFKRKDKFEEEYKALRKKLCLELRHKGYSTSKIASILNLSIGVVSNSIRYDDGSVCPPLVRREVRERDSNKCRMCESRWALNVHHIRTKGHEILNLITLCFPCHIKVERLKKDTVAYNELSDKFIKDNEKLNEN